MATYIIDRCDWMDAKIRAFFGLTLLTAIGVIATTFALSLFSAKPASADLAAATVVVTPDKARSIGQYTITVSGGTGMSVILVGGSITVTFNNKTGVPSSIVASAIKLRATEVSDGGAANLLVNAAAVTVSGRAVTITVPDMDPAPGTGDNGIAGNGSVTITLTQAAGIQNPDQASSSLTLTVKTSAEPTAVTSFAYTITSFVSFSPSSAARGTTLTVTGGGFTANCTICNIRFSPQNVIAPVSGAVGTGSIDANGVFIGTVTLTSSTSAGGYVWVTDSVGVSAVSSTIFVQTVLPPHVVLGTVTFDGAPAVDSTPVTAWVNGAQVAATNASGGSYTLVIGSQAGFAWKIVAFRIGAATANQSIEWQRGGANILNLTASSSSCTEIVEVALAPLGGNLVRVWQYVNEKQAWTVYDPRILELSDLAIVIQGGIYWILVDHEQPVTVCGKEINLFPGWNLILWG